MSKSRTAIHTTVKSGIIGTPNSRAPVITLLQPTNNRPSTSVSRVISVLIRTILISIFNLFNTYHMHVCNVQKVFVYFLKRTTTILGYFIAQHMSALIGVSIHRSCRVDFGLFWKRFVFRSWRSFFVFLVGRECRTVAFIVFACLLQNKRHALIITFCIF